MEPNDKSVNSRDAEEFNKRASSMESGISDNNETSDSNEDTQHNIQPVQKHDETGHSEEYPKSSRNKDECLKVEEFVWSIITFAENLTSNIPSAVDIVDLQIPESRLSTSSDAACGSSDPSDIPHASTFGKDLTSNIPSAVDTVDLQIPKFRLSSTSSDETCGSSDPSYVPFKEEPLGDLEDNSEIRELDCIWHLKNPISWLRRKNVKKISNTPSITSSSDTNLDNASEATKWAFTSSPKKSSFQKESTAIKSPDTSNTYGPVDFSSIPQDMFPGHIKEREVPSEMPFFDTHFGLSTNEGMVSNACSASEAVARAVARSLSAREVETSEISDRVKTPASFAYISDEENYWKNEKSVRRKVKKELPTGEVETSEVSDRVKTPAAFSCISDEENYWKNEKSVRRKVRKELPTGEVETSEISASGKTPGAVDYNSDEESYWKNEKSVRRKVRKELPTSPKTDYLPTSSSASSISRFSRNIGRSLLQISKSVEQTLPEDDWNLSINCARRSGVKYFVPKPWVEDFLSLGYETTAELESKKLLDEVHLFFKDNHMDADVNMSWEERKHQIITSKYFSDEFCRIHELATYEELMKRGLKDLETSTPPIAKTEQELLKLCKTLMEQHISEEDFIESVGMELLSMLCDSGYGMKSTIEPYDAESEEYLNNIFTTIMEEHDLLPMVKLYAKLVYEGATYLSILDEWKNPVASAD